MSFYCGLLLIRFLLCQVFLIHHLDIKRKWSCVTSRDPYFGWFIKDEFFYVKASLDIRHFLLRGTWCRMRINIRKVHRLKKLVKLEEDCPARCCAYCIRILINHIKTTVGVINKIMCPFTWSLFWMVYQRGAFYRKLLWTSDKARSVECNVGRAST